MTSQKPEASSFGASTIKGAVRRLIESGKFTRQQLAGRLGLTPDEMDKLMADHGEADLPQALHRLLEEYGIRPAAAAVDASRSLLTLAANPDQEESDPFVGSAEDVSADETRQKIELFAWADNVLGLSEAELELALEKAIRRFECNRETLKRIIKARRSDKQKARARAAQSHAAGRPEEDIAYYGPGRDYKVSSRGVFVRLLNAEGDPTWEQICTTRIDLLALTRDTRQERWGTYVEITNRDGRTKQLAIPHSLTAADKLHVSLWFSF